LNEIIIIDLFYVGRDNSRKNVTKIFLCYLNSEQYKRSLKEDRKHGQDIYHFINGNKYINEWNNDKMNRQGCFLWFCGNWYDGYYQDAEMHGLGIFHLFNGHKYVDEWTTNMRNGHGIYSWPHGNYYESEHQNNTFDRGV